MACSVFSRAPLVARKEERRLNFRRRFSNCSVTSSCRGTRGTAHTTTFPPPLFSLFPVRVRVLPVFVPRDPFFRPDRCRLAATCASFSMSAKPVVYAPGCRDRDKHSRSVRRSGDCIIAGPCVVPATSMLRSSSHLTVLALHPGILRASVVVVIVREVLWRSCIRR